MFNIDFEVDLEIWNQSFNYNILLQSDQSIKKYDGFCDLKYVRKIS